MNIWSYVQKYTYSSPEKQISLLIDEVTNEKKKNNMLKVLDVGGGLRDRKKVLNQLGECTTFDIEKGPNVDVVGDAHKLPFKDKSYDIVTLFMVLEHLHDPAVAFKECNRVLKPGGILLVTTVQYWHTHSWPHDYYRYTKQGLTFLVEKAGLKVNKIWSMGGPFLVVFHSIELNLPGLPRKLFLLTCPFFNFLDKLIFNHEDKRKYPDSVGWSLIAHKE